MYTAHPHHISEFNVAFDPLHFVLMFPRGEAGWGLGVKKGLLRNVPNASPVVIQAPISPVYLITTHQLSDNAEEQL